MPQIGNELRDMARRMWHVACGVSLRKRTQTYDRHNMPCCQPRLPHGSSIMTIMAPFPASINIVMSPFSDVLP